MTHAQAERLNSSGRCQNPTAGAAPWLARKQNVNAATKVVGRNSLLTKSEVQHCNRSYINIAHQKNYVQISIWTHIMAKCQWGWGQFFFLSVFEPTFSSFSSFCLVAVTNLVLIGTDSFVIKMLVLVGSNSFCRIWPTVRDTLFFNPLHLLHLLISPLFTFRFNHDEMAEVRH